MQYFKIGFILPFICYLKNTLIFFEQIQKFPSQKKNVGQLPAAAMEEESDKAISWVGGHGNKLCIEQHHCLSSVFITFQQKAKKKLGGYFKP